MSKAIYLGSDDNKSSSVTAINIGINNIARKVTYAYIGDNSGKARIVFSNMPAKGNALNSYTWEEISKVSKAGLASSYWSVGDTKSITIGGTAYAARIIGFDHDTPTNTASYGRSKAGITFELTTLYNTGYVQNPTANASDGGGWDTSALRTSLNSTVYNAIQSDARAVIVPVNKKSGHVNEDDSTGIITTSDKVFILSLVELRGVRYTDDDGSRVYAVSGEGSRYAYYTSGGDIVKGKLTGETDGQCCHIRSVSTTYYYYFMYIYGGYKGSGYGDIYADATFDNDTEVEFAPAFCV